MANAKLIKNEDGSRSLTVIWDGNILTADSSHARFDDMVDLALNGGDTQEEMDELADLFSPAQAISRKFADLSADIRVDAGVIYHKGNQVNGVLSDLIVKLFEEDEDYVPFVRFLERCQNNPNPESVEHLYRWISDLDFTITDDGRFLAYKGLNSNSTSINAGPGIRNGVAVNGNILNLPGDVVEMARDQVTFDKSVGCAQGLHAGTWSYANSFSRGVVVKVVIDPEHVVSVPTDCYDAKLRVCRYEVVEVVQEPVKTSYESGYYSDPDLEEDISGLDELEGSLGEEDNRITWASIVGSATDTRTDTTLNHLSQSRDSFGRFIKKGI